VLRLVKRYVKICHTRLRPREKGCHDGINWKCCYSAIPTSSWETAEEMQTLTALGVECAQGYYLGAPGPLPV
jgi:hypothetical protein